MAALTQDQINQFTELNKSSGFNYKLPDGTVINTGNYSEAATVDVGGIMTGQVASPIPKALLDWSKSYNPAGDFTAGSAQGDDIAARTAYLAGRTGGDFVQDLGTADGIPDPIDNSTPSPFGSDYLANGALTPEAQARDAAAGKAASLAAAASTTGQAGPGGMSAPGSQPALSPAAMGAQTLYDFYTAQGQALPPLAQRGALYQQLTGQPASTYTGSVAQNNALLAALKSQGGSMGGSGGYGTSGGATGAGGANAGLNNTPTGSALAGLTGMSASEVLKNYSAVLSSAMTGDMAKEMGDVAADRNAINDFFSNRKPADQILREEFARRGIEEKNSLLSELDKEILAQTRRLRNLPENIKQGLQDVGVTQGQLDRLVVAESRKPSELLRDLMENRNALANDVETATKFAEKFAGTILEEQAAKLAAMQWQLGQDQDDVKNLQAEQKIAMSLAIDERKMIMDMALDAAKSGAPQNVIDSILKTNSANDAVRIGGTYLAKAASGASGNGSDLSGGGYTNTELKKLRAAGINPTNIKNSDAYLYGVNEGKMPATRMTVEQVKQFASAMVPLITGSSGTTKIGKDDVSTYKNIHELMSGLAASDVVEINGQNLIINETTRNAIRGELEALKGGGTFGNPWGSSGQLNL